MVKTNKSELQPQSCSTKIADICSLILTTRQRLLILPRTRFQNDAVVSDYLESTVEWKVKVSPMHIPGLAHGTCVDV